MTTSGRFTLLGCLYFAQGLPFGFFVQALPVILRKQGFSLSQIGFTSLLALPWALKFVWAPMVDRHWWPRLGRRRTWILTMQLVGTLVLVAVALAPSQIWVLLAAMLALSTVAATQDVATDGLAVDMLPVGERGFANGLQVAGYRVGMIFGGGLLLGFHAELGHQGTFVVMAVLTALATVPVLIVGEPVAAPANARHPGAHYLTVRGVWRLLTLIVLYKAGESFAQGMLRTFLVDDYRLGEKDLATMIGTVGFLAGMAGALAGGLLVSRIGRRRALVAFGIGQVITVGGYFYLAVVHGTTLELYTWCGVEHFASGMATAALFTCMMDWTRPASTGTDYTVQASAVVIAQTGFSALSGMSAQALGYPGHFALATALCAIAAVLAGTLFTDRISS